jgi:murein DD-endopeptidase MepM/ murein hydrolase activator NlpD
LIWQFLAGLPDMNNMSRLKICLAILLSLLPTFSAAANERWAGPLNGKLIVVRGFDGAAYQANHYGPAHRGVDLLSKVGDRVFAPTDGVVAYVGVINSIPIVVIAHKNSGGNGIADKRVRTTYLPVETQLIVGDAVSRSQLIGVVGAQTHLYGKTVLHWGERLNREYKNPLRRLGAPVLLPRLS